MALRKDWELVKRGFGPLPKPGAPALTLSFAINGPPPSFYDTPDNAIEMLTRAMSPPFHLYLYAARLPLPVLRKAGADGVLPDMAWQQSSGANSVYNVLRPFADGHPTWIGHGEVWRRPWGSMAYTDRFEFGDKIRDDACDIANMIWEQNTLQKARFPHLEDWVRSRVPGGLGSTVGNRILVILQGALKKKWALDRGWPTTQDPRSPADACARIHDLMDRYYWDVNKASWKCRV